MYVNYFVKAYYHIIDQQKYTDIKVSRRQNFQNLDFVIT